MRASREIYHNRGERVVLLAVAGAFGLALAYQLGAFAYGTFVGGDAEMNLPAAIACLVMAAAFVFAASLQTVITVDDQELRITSTYFGGLKRTRSISIPLIESVEAGRDSGNDPQLELRMRDGTELFIHGGGESAARWLREMLEYGRPSSGRHE